jgi:hypothetical protein
MKNSTWQQMIVEANPTLFVRSSRGIPFSPGYPNCSDGWQDIVARLISRVLRSAHGHPVYFTQIVVSGTTMIVCRRYDREADAFVERSPPSWAMGKLRDAECRARLVIEVIEGPNWNSVDAQFAIRIEELPARSSDDHKKVGPDDPKTVRSSRQGSCADVMRDLRRCHALLQIFNCIFAKTGEISSTRTRAYSSRSSPPVFPTGVFCSQGFVHRNAWLP